MRFGKFNVVMDLQWGSCGKGKVAAWLAWQCDVRNVSASHRPNAGHTVVNGAEKFIAKALPSAAILNKWKRPMTCWLSAASAFWQEQLNKEREQCNYPGILVHGLAQRMTAEDVQAELSSIAPIASTLQGSGAALAKKIMRTAETCNLSNPGEFTFRAQTEVQNSLWLHECAQGWALSLEHGHQYPYVTSRNCGTAAALDQLAVSPRELGDVYGVFRPYPIRVGNLGQETSGPTYSDSAEISWDNIAEAAGIPSGYNLAEREHTTVTHRLRRVFSLSLIGLRQAIRANGVNKLVLNFAQYIDFADYKKRRLEDLSKKTRKFIDMIEAETSVEVVAVGTGEDMHDMVQSW